MTGTEIISEEYTAVVCCDCGTKFWMDSAIHAVALIRAHEFEFWCPNGHRLHFDRDEKPADGPNPGEEAGEDDETGKVVRFPVVVARRA